MVLWNIKVTDITTNRGVANAKVSLIAGGGALCFPSAQAEYTQYTNTNGIATFNIPSGFYRVGILASGYESAHAPHTPAYGCEWTCHGAGGARDGDTYNFPVKPTVAPPPRPPPLNGLQLSGQISTVDPAHDAGIFTLQNGQDVEVQIWLRMVEPDKDFPNSSDWQLIREGILNTQGKYTTNIGFPKPEYSGYKVQIAGVDEYEVHSNVITFIVSGEVTPPPVDEEKEPTPPPSKEGCFIATACYGSPTHSKVNELRKIKNDLIEQSQVAMFLYNLYYVFSPAVAQKIKDMPRIKAVIRKMIDLLT